MTDDSADLLAHIASGSFTEADASRLVDLLRQNNYEISISHANNVHIGDRIYQFSKADIQAIIAELRSRPETSQYLQIGEACQNRGALDLYLDSVLKRLRQAGSLDVRRDVAQGSYAFRYAARIQDFELPFGLINMRGEAFFIFSEFSAIQMTTLRQFSGRALQWARQQVVPGAAGQAIYDFRFPTHTCFAVALVDEVDADTQTALRTTNPLDHKINPLWYEVPVVYALNSNQLLFYDQPSNFWETFKGEIAWKRLRAVVQQLLVSPPN